MPWTNFAAVGLGAALGAWTRWGLSILLNPVLPSLPLGTLAANLIGGLLIGVVMGLAEPLNLSVATRLMVVTGFLGGLTTFSTFSAETVGLALKGETGWSALVVVAHLAGSLLLTGLGVAIARGLVGR
jgi:CrcB protein